MSLKCGCIVCARGGRTRATNSRVCLNSGVKPSRSAALSALIWFCLFENQRMMQAGCNQRSGAAAPAELQRTFEHVFRGRGLFLRPIFASRSRSLCIPASRCQGWRIFIKHISFLFYPSVSLAPTLLLLLLCFFPAAL